MSEMTPESMKKQLKMVNRLGPLDSMRIVLLWEADRKNKELAQSAMDNLARKLTVAEARIGALEGALADIAYSSDMTLEIARNKARRTYGKQVAALAAEER